MFIHTAKRALSALVLTVAVATVTFFMLYGMGGDPVANLLGNTATRQQIAIRRAELGLDRPVLVQYFHWAAAAVHGDLGTSWTNRQPVTDALVARIPVTLSLAALASLVSTLVGAALGVAAARWRGWGDRLLQLLVIAGFALPGFWLAAWFSTTFAVGLHWFPAIGYTPLGQSVSGWLQSVTLPAAALAVGASAGIAQQVRNSVIEVERKDFVRVLRSRGLGRSRILVRHVLRNAAPAALTTFSLQFIGLLGGTIIVENIFALPGLGALAISATNVGDVPVVMGITLFTVVVVVVVNLGLDLLQGLLNPKARMS